jgi:hypothetical protein
MFSREQIEKARKASSVNELMSLANEEGFSFSEEVACGCFEQLHRGEGEVSDDELDNVAGGCYLDKKGTADTSCTQYEASYDKGFKDCSSCVHGRGKGDFDFTIYCDYYHGITQRGY